MAKPTSWCWTVPCLACYEHDEDEGWRPFRSFASRLNCEMRDPNLKFVDLDGDGHADVLITEDDALVWHRRWPKPASARPGELRRRSTRRTARDWSSPMARSRSTWPISAATASPTWCASATARSVTGPTWATAASAPKSPWTTRPGSIAPDHFDHRRIRLADIDGERHHRHHLPARRRRPDLLQPVRQQLERAARADARSRTSTTSFPSSTADLLGNGTACLVWSSPLPGDARRPMRYIDLMGGQKPHLLVRTSNNLGAETTCPVRAVDQVLSAGQAGRQALDHQAAVSRACVEKVTVTDKWRKTCFSSTYSYHHGYFDGIEREFRGFGRVEQVDVGVLRRVRAAAMPPAPTSPTTRRSTSRRSRPSPGITPARSSTASASSTQFEHEYFPRWLEDRAPRPSTFGASRRMPCRSRISTAEEPQCRGMARGPARLQGHGAAPGGLRTGRRCAGAPEDRKQPR